MSCRPGVFAIVLVSFVYLRHADTFWRHASIAISYAVLFSAGGVHHLTGSRQTLWLLKPPLGSCKLNLDWRSSPQRASYHIGLASNPSILSTWFCPSAVWYSWSWLSVQTLVPPPMATQYHLPAFCWSWRVSMLTRHYERLGLLLDSVLLELESESAGAGG